MVEDKTDKKPKKEKQKKERAAKLGFKEERELKELPGKIEALEAEQNALFSAMSDPAFYKQGGQKAAETKARMEEIEAALKASYSRWEELEAIKAASAGA